MPSQAAKAVKALLLAALVGVMALTGFAVLAIAGLESGAPAFVLALLLAVVPVPLYLALVLWIDRFEPEPLRMVALTFAWGATVAAFVAAVLNTVGQALVSQELGTEAGTLYGYSISAPVVEEGIKGLALLGVFLLFRREFNGIIDGIVYAGCVGLGFAMTENVLYYGRGAAEEGVVGAVGTFVVRGLMSPFAHPVFTAMTGIGLGIAASTSNRALRVLAPIAGLLAAMLLHSAWNTGAGTGFFFGVYLLIMVPVFVAIGLAIRWALRRESRVIARQLRGTLPDPEVQALASLRERRRWRQKAARRGGKPAKRAMADLQQAAAELAFQRQQVERGVLRGDRRLQARESLLLAHLAQRRRELSQLPG